MGPSLETEEQGLTWMLRQHRIESGRPLGHRAIYFLTFLDLTSLVYKIRIIKVPTSEGCCEFSIVKVLRTVTTAWYVLDKSQLVLLLKLDLWVWESYLSSLNFSFSLCKNRDYIVITQFCEIFSPYFKVIWSKWILYFMCIFDG